MYLRLITIVLLILLWLPGYSQIKPHSDGFICSRTFMELVASRFDSLKHYKVVVMEMSATLDSCYSVVQTGQKLNSAQTQKIASLQKETEDLRDIIEIYNREQLVYKDYQKKYTVETRRKKTWKVIGIGVGAGLLTALLLLAL